MFINTSISTSMLIGCGPKKSNFQILVMESSNKQVQYVICKATTLKYKTWQWYKTQRMGTDFCTGPSLMFDQSKQGSYIIESRVHITASRTKVSLCDHKTTPQVPEISSHHNLYFHICIILPHHHLYLNVSTDHSVYPGTQGQAKHFHVILSWASLFFFFFF